MIIQLLLSVLSITLLEWGNQENLKTYNLNLKFAEATNTGDFSQITEDDKARMLETTKSVY